MTNVEILEGVARELNLIDYEIEKSRTTASAYLTFKSGNGYKRARLAGHDAIAHFSKCEIEAQIRYRLTCAEVEFYISSGEKFDGETYRGEMDYAKAVATVAKYLIKEIGKSIN